LTTWVWRAERAHLGDIVEVGQFRSRNMDLAKRSTGTRGMPRRGQAMKDVASCDKPWGGARYL
jgi:hypothetical protein